MRLRVLLLILALTVLLRMPAVAGPAALAEAEFLHLQAAALYSEGHYTEAEPLFKRVLEIDETEFGPDHAKIATDLENLADLYRVQGRAAEAGPLYDRSLAIREKTLGSEHVQVADILNKQGMLSFAQGRYAEAEQAFKRALAIKEKQLGPDHPDVATILVNLALAYGAQGRYAEAAPLNERALAIKEKQLGPDSPDVAVGLNSQAMMYFAQGRYGEAEQAFKRALAIKEKQLGPDHPDVAAILNNLALTYIRQTRYAEAEPALKRVLAIKEKELGPTHSDVATVLNNLANLYDLQGRYGDAEELFRRTLAIKEEALGPDHPDVATALYNLALFYKQQGRVAAALPAITRAVAIMAKHLSVSSAQRVEITDAERRADRAYFVDYIAIAASATGAEPTERNATATETFRVAQLAQASSAGRALARMTARFAAGGTALAAAIRERQDLAEQWRRLDADIVKAWTGVSVTQQPGGAAGLRTSLDDTERRLDALDHRLAAEFPDFAELSNPQPLPAQATQALLDNDEALLVYLTTDEGTWLWVLRRDDVALYRLSIDAAELRHAVTVLRRDLDPEFNADLRPFPAGDAYELYQKILAPAVPRLSGAHRLLIVPDGSLESLPLSVLVTAPPEHRPERAADHRALAWLSRDYAVTVLPSVAALRSLRQLRRQEDGLEPFLGVGDPLLTGQKEQARGEKLAQLFRGAAPDADEVRKLPALPETADELRAIAKTLGASEHDLLLGEQASEPVLRKMPLDHYRIIEFATHGLVAGDLPGLAEPALVLTPPPTATPDDNGLLTASKIATLKLNADWVVLSACNTAADDGTPDGGGLSGLAKAFFYAGARSLLVSHWEVPSRATVALTTGTFAELEKDPTIGRAEALRRSEMAMLNPANPAEFAHPMFWAPFVLAGEGGGGR
jgi:CHAT domain-containing protein/Tfp pilus assembly protein PilF